MLVLNGLWLLGHIEDREIVVVNVVSGTITLFISLFWAFTYMAAGAWLGMRLFLTGAVAVVGIVAGYLYIHEHFALWMAFFAGGSLMLALPLDGGNYIRDKAENGAILSYVRDRRHEPD